MQHRGATPSMGTSTLYAYAWTHKAQQTEADGTTTAQKKPTQFIELICVSFLIVFSCVALRLIQLLFLFAFHVEGTHKRTHFSLC